MSFNKLNGGWTWNITQTYFHFFVSDEMQNFLEALDVDHDMFMFSLADGFPNDHADYL